VLSHDTSKELRPDEIPLIRNARLLQFTAAGVDWVPTRDLPSELPVAANKGGGAEPMAEHIVALALAAAKRLFIEPANLKSGEFNQRSANRLLRGGVCGSTQRPWASCVSTISIPPLRSRKIPRTDCRRRLDIDNDCMLGT